MLKTILLLITSFFLLSANLDNPKTTELCDCFQENKIIKCNRNYDKCIVDRKKITYFVEVKKTNNAKRMLLEVTKSVGGSSNLVYSGRVYIVEKKAENLCIIKIPMSINKSYQWDDLTREDFLIVTYNTKTQDFTLEAEGKMANFVDKDHGLALPSIKSEMANVCKSKPYEPKSVVKAASAYFVLEYTKALKS